jgi:biopolymer transport protein ExbD
VAIAGPTRGAIKSDINITPLADVVLVLLIIFLVVTPLLERGKDVRLPSSQVTDEERRGGDPLTVSITPDGAVFVERERVDGELERRLRDEILASPHRPILLKADESLTVGEVRRVMATARRVGARGVRLAVDPVKRGS